MVETTHDFFPPFVVIRGYLIFESRHTAGIALPVPSPSTAILRQTMPLDPVEMIGFRSMDKARRGMEDAK